MIKILNVEPAGYADEARRVLQSIGELHERALARDGLIKALPDFNVLIVRLGFQIDRQIIDVGQRLQAIVTPTTGLDHIDVAYAQSRGIAVLSLKGETEFLRSVPASAEHTWALLLALVRRVPAAYQSVLRGEWNREEYRGHDLAGLRLGILGVGRIGEKIARYGQAFDMCVSGYDPYRVDWPDGVERMTTAMDLLSQADVLSIHVPLNEETEHLIGAPELALLPQGSYLVNTARGEIVDETALIAALESGHLRGAALDVIWGEREPARRQASPLLAYAREHSNLLITPHIGGATWESMHMTEVFMARRLAQFFSQR